jgi:DeoR family ulaG and ulaABCDEF operon transcriptional repressor
MEEEGSARIRVMHVAEREKFIIQRLDETGFVSFQELEERLPASPATIRRDLERLAEEGQITRVRGGAKKRDANNAGTALTSRLDGVPFHENISRNLPAKRAIGKAAAALCTAAESVMIDGGSTTLQMCPHLEDLHLQVLTNSLHIVSALLGQPKTRIIVPSGQIFREQNIILSIADTEELPRVHAPKLFMGAACIGPRGLMQVDSILAAAERRLIDRAEQLIVLVDSSKFEGPSGHVVCRLDEIDVIITDADVLSDRASMVKKAGIDLIIANPQ